MNIEFIPFPKIARLNREIVITEKLDGTNAQVHIRPADDRFEFGVDTQIEIGGEPHYIRAGSRTRWLTMGGKGDNFGFGAWVYQNAHALSFLGAGQHFGEWWGSGIQRGYGLPKGEKRFSLFNTSRWDDAAVRPDCCGVVPVLYQGPFDQDEIDMAIEFLAACGSQAAPGFMDPEGIIVYHTAANQLFKVTVKNDEVPKALVTIEQIAEQHRDSLVRLAAA